VNYVADRSARRGRAVRRGRCCPQLATRPAPRGDPDRPRRGSPGTPEAL